MRILASNPDTLGDLILRQPMYRALQDAGHELALIVRPTAAALVRHVAPGARILELPHEAYAHDLPEHWDRFAELFDTARAFDPAGLIVAPYRWTLFDERLADELPERVKRFGLNGHLYRGDPHLGPPPASGMRFDVVAEVCEDAPEVEKNAVLASAVLGKRPGSLPHPRIEIPEPDRARAAQILSELGLAPGEYWIACVSGTAHVSLKAWPPERWAQTLSRWSAKHPHRRFLFVGLASEQTDVDAVRRQMTQEARAQTRVWMPPGGTIDELLALCAVSGGYVGHDTGPMHAAAAVGRPVLAVFGGGHKLRFQPAAEPSVTLTVGVGCRGCGWICSFAESHCVKAVSVDDVVGAAEDLEAGRVTGREARVTEPSHNLETRMIREAAAATEDRLRAAAELSRQLRETQAGWARDVTKLREDAAARSEEVETALAGRQAAVEQAHAELGGQLREKESIIRRQDEHLREKDSMIREQDQHLRQKNTSLDEKEAALREKDAALRERQAALQEKHDALHRTAAEAERLREHLEATSQRNTTLDTALEARAAELDRLRGEYEAKSEEASQLAATLHGQRDEIDRLARDLDATRGQIEQADRERAEATRQQADELARLREHFQKLEDRMRLIEPRIHQPRRPLKQVLVDFIIGAQHHYPPPPKPLPGITVVTVTHNDGPALRDTIESVLGQTHAHVQYVVVDRGSTDNTPALLDAYRGRIDKILAEPADAGMFDALEKGYALATYDVLGRLDPGDAYEPGALTRVAEHFRDHARHKAAVFEEARADAGWRFPAPAPTTPDVHELLARGADAPTGGVFVTTNAYKAIGGINREHGQAAEWDLLLRIARRYGIHVGTGHVRTTRVADRTSMPDAGRAEDFVKARELFEITFGWAGRIRCGLLHVVSRLGDARRRMLPGRMSFAIGPAKGKPLPVGVAPARAPADQPVCPLSGRLPDRLLFSARDTVGRDDAISYVYYDAADDAALVYPPIDLEKLRAIYQDDARRPGKVTPPDPARRSPYAGYRGRGVLARALSRVRCPYWWFRKPDFGDPSVAELLNTLEGPVPQRGVAVRLLNVGCFEGGVLDALKTQTDWILAGTETNPAAARAARAKGHTVWETSAEDAALVLPVGRQFDVIYLAGLLEHLPDPLLVLRRLRQLLAPGGRVVLDTPNLDSKLLDVFGPTWSCWQLPYHRTLLGRRGLRLLARLGSFRVERLRTRTHPLSAVKSVQLNALGLGAVIPDNAEFPPDVASRGVLLTGWARLLWDWRGRGDYLYAVLRAE